MASKRGHSAPRNTVSIYVRLSREATEQNLSKEGMVADCRTVAAREGLAVVAVHIDDGISGSVRNRPEFVGWLNDARDGRVDTLLVWHADRLTREGVNAAALILDTIEGKNPETGRVVREPVRLIDTRGMDSAGDDTAFRFSFVIAAEVARAERERMKERNRAANARGRAAGRWTGGAAPYGFRVVDNPDGPGRVLEIVPEEAALLREAAAMILAGANLPKAVRWANGPNGRAPRRAPAWSVSTLRQSLTNSATAGQVVRIVDGKPVQVLDDAGQPVTWPAILTLDESAAIRAALAMRKLSTPRGGRQPARLLSGLMTCHSCGGKLEVGQRTGSVSYRCPTARRSLTCDRPVSISAVPAEDFVSAYFLHDMDYQPEYVRRAEVTGAHAVEQAEKAHADAVAALAVSATAGASLGSKRRKPPARPR